MPLIIVGIAWLGLHQSIIRSSEHARITYTYLDNSLVACGPVERIATGITVLGNYILKTIVPVNLSYDYSFNQIPCVNFSSPLVWLTVIACIGLLFAAWKFRITKPVITFGILFFFISISLVINIFTLIGATMGDRLLFTPVLGILLAFVYTAYSLFGKIIEQTTKQAAFVAVIIISVIFSGMSFVRNKDWKSNETLFVHDANEVKNSARAQFNKGSILMAALPEDVNQQQTKLPKVIACFDAALKIDPNDFGSHVNIAVCHYKLKQYDLSVQHTRRAMELNAADKTLYGNLADAYMKNNQPDSAIRYYNMTIDAGLATENTYNFLGAVLFGKEEIINASAIFKRGLELFPNHIEMRMNYGSVLAMQKQLPEAIEQFKQILVREPNNAKAFYMISLAYKDLGDMNQSDIYLQKYNAIPK